MGQSGDRQCLGCGDKCRVDGKRPSLDMETAKMGFWEELPTLGNSRILALGLVVIFMYLFSELGGGCHLLFMSPGWTRTPPPFSAGRPPRHLLPCGLSSLLKPASLCPGAGDTRPETLLTWKCPPCLFTRLLMCFARLMLSQWHLVLPPICTGRFRWHHPRVPHQSMGCSFSPGCNQKTDECLEETVVSMCAPLHGIPRSRQLAELAHRKGCWLLLQAPTASSGGPVWWDAGSRISPRSPGSSLRSGGGPHGAGRKPGVACAPWMLLQAGKLLLVPAMPMPQDRDPWL